MKMAAHLSLAFKVALQFQKHNEVRERFHKVPSIKVTPGVTSGSMVTR